MSLAPSRRSLAALGLLAALAVTTGGTPIHGPDGSPDGPFFVIAATFRSKPSAQAEARTHGGWVLRTDLYRSLTPGLFAVVHGPFERRADAEAALGAIRQRQPEAYVRTGGRSILPAALGDPALLAALLGEVTAEVEEGASAPCAPAEPHLRVRFAGPGATDLAAFYVLRRTGEVVPARACDGR